MRWLILLGFLLLTGCATTHFGVSEEVWQQMSEAERMEAIRGYNERKRLQDEANQREAEARRIAQHQTALARQEAEIREAARAREAARLQEERIRAIHAGQGRPGDLIRVSLQGGQIFVAGKHRDYAPMAFSLASGESRLVELQSDERRQPQYLARMLVTYADGLLLIDDHERRRDRYANSRPDSRPIRLTYQPEWRHGMRYRLNSEGPLALRDVEVMVSAPPPEWRR
jgi:hypothetical protein